jgi:hypothetical protein
LKYSLVYMAEKILEPDRVFSVADSEFILIMNNRGMCTKKKVADLTWRGFFIRMLEDVLHLLPPIDEIVVFQQPVAA